MARGVIEDSLVSTTLCKALVRKGHRHFVVEDQVVDQTVTWYPRQVQHQVSNRHHHSHLRFPIL